MIEGNDYSDIMKIKNKLKNIIVALITLCYVLTIGTLILNYENYIFEEQWIYIITIVLLCIGFYNFIKQNTNK